MGEIFWEDRQRLYHARNHLLYDDLNEAIVAAL